MLRFVLISCLFLHFGNSLSILTEPEFSLLNQQNHDAVYLERLNELKTELKDKMRTIANILNYIETYTKINSKDGQSKVELKEDPMVLSKVDVWLDDDNNGDIPMEAIGGILEAALHDRFKRSAKKDKRANKAQNKKKTRSVKKSQALKSQ